MPAPHRRHQSRALVCPVRRPTPHRWLLASVGMLCVGLGAVGVFVPGLPTTVFLIVAAWCFTRSCPWLEERLIRVPLFRPFQQYLEPGAPMPRRARVTALVAMWTAIVISSIMVGGGLLPAILVLAGGLGTVVILRIRRDDKRAASRPPACPYSHQARD